MTAAAPDDSNFANLLDLARAGDGHALEQVLDQTESRLRRYVDARLGSRLRAALRRSDVLQNAYVEMLDALPQFEGRTEDEFVAWVARIVEHDIKRQNRWFGAQKRRPPSRTSERNALAKILLDSQPTPSAEISGLEERAELQRALARLEPDHAQILQLSVFEELSHKDVAERMQRSEGACRMLLLRARTALALELERHSSEDSAD